jgi:hypothetical protein
MRTLSPLQLQLRVVACSLTGRPLQFERGSIAVFAPMGPVFRLAAPQIIVGCVDVAIKGGTIMDLAFIKAKAEQCRRMADMVTNREIREWLDELAHEFETRAAALGPSQGERRTDEV